MPKNDRSVFRRDGEWINKRDGSARASSVHDTQRAAEAAARQMRGQVSFAKVNTEAQPGLASQYAIRSIPTLAVFSGGREIARVSGAMPAPELQRWLESTGVTRSGARAAPR